MRRILLLTCSDHILIKAENTPESKLCYVSSNFLKYLSKIVRPAHIGHCCSKSSFNHAPTSLQILRVCSRHVWAMQGGPMPLIACAAAKRLFSDRQKALTDATRAAATVKTHGVKAERLEENAFLSAHRECSLSETMTYSRTPALNGNGTEGAGRCQRPYSSRLHCNFTVTIH